MSKLSDFEKQKAAAQRRADKQREKQNSPEYRAKQLEKQRESTQRQQQKQRDKQQARLGDPEYRQVQLEKARAKQEEQRVKQKAKAQLKPQKSIKAKPAKPVDVEAQRAKQLAAAQRQQQRQRDKQQAQLADPEYQQRKKISSRVKPIKSKGLKGRARTAEEKRLETLIARIGCICCKNKGWYTEAMNNQEGQHFISMHHVDGRTKPWCHAKQLPLCQYHHDTPPPQGAPEQLFPLHGTGRKLWEKVNGTQAELLQQVYDMVGEQPPWLQVEAIDEELA